MRLGRLWAWLFLLLGVLLLVQTRIHRADLQRGTTDMLTYPVLAEGTRFGIAPGVPELKLLTWLVHPPEWARDARETRPYQIDVALLDPAGTQVWSDTFWIRSRGGLIEADDRAGLSRPALYTEGGAAVSDDRMNVLDIRDLLPDGGELVIRPLVRPEGSQVLALLYQHEARSDLSMQRLMGDGYARYKAHTARRFTPFGWDSLPRAWRENLAGTTWRSVAALPPPGADVVATTRIDARFRRVHWEDASSLGIPVPIGGAVAFNLEGRVNFSASWWNPDGTPSAPVDTQLRVLTLDGAEEVREIPAATDLGPFAVDGPLTSIQIALAPTADGPRYLRARTHGPLYDRAWGDPHRRQNRDEPQHLGPDLRNIEAYRLAPDLPPLLFTLGPDERARFTFRKPMAPAPLPAFTGPRAPEPWRTWGGGDGQAALVGDPQEGLTDALDPDEPGVLAWVQALDADGAVLEEWTRPLAPVPSIFERYTQGDTPATARVAEPEVLYVDAPPGTAKLQVQANDPVDVSMRVTDPWAPERVLAREYEIPEIDDRGDPEIIRLIEAAGSGDDDDTEGADQVRYEPYIRDPWRARSPDGYPDLAEAKRVIRIDAQVRLEPEGWNEYPVQIPYARKLFQGGQRVQARETRKEWALPIPAAFDLVAERDADGIPGAGARGRISASPSRVQVADSGRLYVDYRVDASAIGQTVTFSVDGGQREVALPAAGGALRLDGLPPGEVEIATDASGLFLARGAGSALWVSRRVYRIDPGETLKIPLEGAPGRLSLHPYLPPGQTSSGGKIDWSIRGQGSARSGGFALKRASGEATPLSFAGRPLQPMSAGRVEIDGGGGWAEVSARGAGGPVYVRATATWIRAEPDSDSHWIIGSPQ